VRPTLGRTLGATAVAVAALALAGCGSDDNLPRADRATAGGAECGGKNTLTAEGSTAQQNAIAVFNQAWRQVCPDKNLAYNPTGSGAGREQFVADQVDFAGSDSAITGAQAEQAAARCAGNPPWNLPLVFGPVAVIYHLDGVDDLVLDADALARIFSGRITRWNDPAIAALNPDAVLPDQPVTPIYRSDSSGTTDNFQRYLATAAPQHWNKGAGSEFQGGVGEGAQKSAGVVQAVQATPGAVGYVEKGFAEHAGMRFARIDNGAGPVALTDETAGRAIDAAGFAGDGHDLILDLDSIFGTTEPDAYPLVPPTYEIVCSAGYDPDTGAAVKAFLRFAATDGQPGLSAAGYVPLPERFKQRLLAAVEAIGTTE